MKHLLLFAAVLVGLSSLVGCPPPPEGCISSSDCPEGQICNVSGECKPASVPPPRDAGPRDLQRDDRTLVPEDAAEVDAPPEDGSIDGGALDGGTFDGSGPAQVPMFLSCNGPSALALTSGEERIYVACEGSDDAVEVYSSIVGRVDNEPLERLYNLPSPCKPRSLLLRQDLGAGQLWLSCSDISNQMIYNVSSTTGLPNEDGFFYGGSTLKARFSSGGNRIAWVGVGDTSYTLRQLEATGASTAVGGATVLNRASDVATTASGDLSFFVNTLSELGAITIRDGDNGALPEINGDVANPTLIETVPSADMIIVANRFSYARMTQAGSSLEGEQSVAGEPLALAVSAGGTYASLVAYDTSSGNSTLYKISTSRADSTPTIGEQVLIGCHAVDVAPATDGRVFVACNNANLVQVITFEE